MLGRRSLLLAGLAGLGGALSACASDAAGPRVQTVDTGPATSGLKPLLVYFSRPGENYFNGGRTDLAVGNTAVMAQVIGELIDVDMHELRAADTYSRDYDATVARNVREQDEQARPAIAGPLPSVAGRRTVLLGSPIWNVQIPRIMRTFVDATEWSGIRVVPFTTHAMSGLGGAVEEYRQACRGATMAEGLAVRGERVRESRPEIEAWLGRVGLQ
ncbi:flavodoxin [Actinomycetota bacterium]